MSSKKKQQNAADLNVLYKNGQAYFIFNEEEILLEPVQGRISGTLHDYRATEESKTDVSLTKLLFSQWTHNQQRNFMLIAAERAEVTGIALRMVGGDLVTGTPYRISDEITDVGAQIKVKGQVIPGNCILEGVLTVLSANEYSIDGYFNFSYTNLQGEREIYFKCNAFAINLQANES